MWGRSVSSSPDGQGPFGGAEITLRCQRCEAQIRIVDGAGASLVRGKVLWWGKVRRLHVGPGPFRVCLMGEPLGTQGKTLPGGAGASVVRMRVKVISVGQVPLCGVRGASPSYGA